MRAATMAPAIVGNPLVNSSSHAFYFSKCMKKLLIYTVASGHYLDYTALWEYCIAHSYPEYDFESLEIKDPKTLYFAACYRLLHQPTTQHDYVYITDVDMMILREESPSLLEFHLGEMENEGLCYSNSPRKKEYLGPQRLTGLHFASKEWYEKTIQERSSYLRLLSEGKFGENAIDDELMLMLICKNAGLSIPITKQLASRHHGIHLGTLRHYQYKRHSKNTRNQQLGLRISPKQAEQWLNFYNDKEFVKIVNAVSKKNREIKLELQRLYSFCRRLKKI